MTDTFRSLADGFAFEDWSRNERLSLADDLRDSNGAGPLQYGVAAATVPQPDVVGSDIATTAVDGFDARIGVTAPETEIFQFENSASSEVPGIAAAPGPDRQLNGSGSVSLTALGSASTQNFDTLASTGTSSTVPVGWYYDESSVTSPANTLYTAGTGSGNGGDTYSFGATGSSDRAFGQLRSGSNVVTLGSQFTNDTGAAIGSLDVSYTGEQWRLGTSGRADSMTFQISFDATSLTTGTWTTVTQLNFTAPISVGTVGALDGNLAANRVAVTHSLTLAQAIASGQSFWIRWQDTDASGSDDGLGIDNFSITPQAAVASPGALSINDVTLAEGNSGTTNFTFTVTRSGGTAGAVSATWMLANGTSDDTDFTTVPQTGTVDFLDGETSKTITITVTGDITVEGNDTFFVNLTAPTGGATIFDAQGLGTITNDDTPPVGTLSINDVSLAEGNSGTTNMVFTVTRSGGSTGAGDVTWTVSNGTTNAADFAGALTGTVSFADGQTTATITVAVAGDTDAEPNENYTVTLSSPTGGLTITDGSAAGTITNDDIAPIANVWINEINYDPAGADANEFIEIAGLAGVDLTGWSLVLYNGGGGASYATLALSGTIASTTNGFGFLKVNALGLQNGSPDGIALVDNLGRVVQFLSYEGAMTATNGPANGLTSTDVGVEQLNAAIGFTLQLQGTGSSYADFTWAANIANTEGAVNAGQSFLSGTDLGLISIRDASVTEGNSGTSTISFTVSRAGGFASTATVNYTVALDGTAFADDFGAGGVFAGTLTFAAGEFTRTITLPIQGDTTGEGNETFTVNLSTPTGNAAIADGSATGTIINDDPVTLTIMQIQGAGHTSAYVGQPVSTSGIVTAVAANGFYLQDPSGDGNSATSDAIFVFTGTVPTVAVGDAVTAGGSVAEFASGAGLSVTQLNLTGVTVNSTGNALPTALLIGTGGLLPPTGVIDNDSFGTYDPANDGIDFWESLEGMRVTLDAPRAVSNTNSFGETDVIVSGGVGATGANARGGITISGVAGVGDYNPEKIQIDDAFGALIGYTPGHSIGDVLASVTGVVNYSFLNYEVLATSAVTVTTDVTLTEEQTSLQGDVNYLTIATYNLENMDPSDNKYTILGHDIVYNLRAPTILAVQEVQDADGAGTGSDLSGVSNVQGLIDAIFAESGITYTYVEIAPTVANTTGGEPNGNIRNGYLYRADQVSLVSGSLALLTDAAYNGSRKPLVATWLFQGTEVTTINVHFTSRGGSDALWGATQPPSNAGDAARTAQAAAVGAYVNNELATDPTGQYMVLGDWNGFYFETAQTQLGTVFTNLATLIPSEERYSYVFEGNSQLLDNIIASGGLLAGAQYDAVHLNAEFAATATRATDHDPQIARLLLGPAPTAFVLTNDSVEENLPAGTVVGSLKAYDPGDTLTYALTDDAGGLFTINAATGEITTTASLNFEALASYSITGRVTDSAGRAVTSGFTITVNNANDNPVAAADTGALNEDATSANLWSALLGNDTDQDTGTTLSIQSVNTAGTLGSVIFDAATQTLQYVANNNAFDTLAPGTTTTDTFTYTISDGNGGASTATVTMTITGVADGTIGTATSTIGEYVIGTAGEDELFGGDGTDFLKGNAGHDWLQGGSNDDKLQGGMGRDTFVFGFNDGLDVVRTFSAADDRIVLLEGGTVIGTSTLDYNQDGLTDLQINFSHQTGVILLGISTIAGIRIDENSTEAPPSTTGGWSDWSLPAQAPLNPKTADWAASSLADDNAAVAPGFAQPSNALQIDYLMLV